MIKLVFYVIFLYESTVARGNGGGSSSVGMSGDEQ